MFLCSMMLVFGVAGSAEALLISGYQTFGTLIDFDDQATGTEVLFDDYASFGVTSITETEGLGTFARYSGSQSAPNYIGTGLNGERGTDSAMGWDGTILIEFDQLASMVGIGIANSRGGHETITAYNSAMNVIETYNAYTDGSFLNGYVSISTNTYNIRYFEITGDFFAIDDLQFDAGSAPVPEPSTILLMGAGLLGLVGYNRKRFRKKS